MAVLCRVIDICSVELYNLTEILRPISFWVYFSSEWVQLKFSVSVWGKFCPWSHCFELVSTYSFSNTLSWAEWMLHCWWLISLEVSSSILFSDLPYHYYTSHKILSNPHVKCSHLWLNREWPSRPFHSRTFSHLSVARNALLEFLSSLLFVVGKMNGGMDDEATMESTCSSGPATPMMISNPGTPRSVHEEYRSTPPPTTSMGHSASAASFSQGGLSHSASSSSLISQVPRTSSSSKAQHAMAFLTQQSQQPQVPQSKYTQLLAVIEDLGKDIRPTYSGSRTSSERLKRGIVHARILVRECLMECERAARSWRASPSISAHQSVHVRDYSMESFVLDSLHAHEDSSFECKLWYGWFLPKWDLWDTLSCLESNSLKSS